MMVFYGCQNNPPGGTPGQIDSRLPWPPCAIRLHVPVVSSAPWGPVLTYKPQYQSCCGCCCCQPLENFLDFFIELQHLSAGQIQYDKLEKHLYSLCILLDPSSVVIAIETETNAPGPLDQLRVAARRRATAFVQYSTPVSTYSTLDQYLTGPFPDFVVARSAHI